MRAYPSISTIRIRPPAPWRISRFAELLIGAIFLVAAIGKVTDPSDVVWSLDYLFGESGFDIRGMFYVLIFSELVAGSLLIAGIFRTFAMTVSIGLLAVFSGWILFSTLQGLEVGCGCGLPELASDGSLQATIALTRNGILIVIAVIAIRAGRIPATLKRQ